MVFGLRLADGRDVVVKARADDGRAVSCVAAQARLAERGFPCARPLTPVAGIGSLAVHAEEFRPGGEVLHGDSPDVAVRYAEVFAWLMAELAGVTVAPPLPNPPWVRWDHADSGMWPAIDFLDNRDQSVVPAHVAEAAERARGRLLAAALPCVLGHADFEAQNIRWHRREVGTVHDWDSLAWQPEAALAGAASGAFASAGPPTLAPIESSEACSAPPSCPAMRSGHKQPNASAGLMPSAGTCQPELEQGVRHPPLPPGAPRTAALVRCPYPHEIKRSPARCGPARWCACGRCSARSSAAVHPAGRPRRVLRSPRPLRSARRRRSGR